MTAHLNGWLHDGHMEFMWNLRLSWQWLWREGVASCSLTCRYHYFGGIFMFLSSPFYPESDILQSSEVLVPLLPTTQSHMPWQQSSVGLRFHFGHKVFSLPFWQTA